MTDAQPRPKRSHIQKEHALQRGVMRAVKRCVTAPHVFQCWDRGAARSALEHVREEARGIQAGWPDTGLFVLGYPALFCELKALGGRPSERQQMIGFHLKTAGCLWFWADSVGAYLRFAQDSAFPLHPNWRAIAAHEDELVAADIRKQEARATKKTRCIECRGSGYGDPVSGFTTVPDCIVCKGEGWLTIPRAISKRPRERVSVSRIARAERARMLPR